MTSIAVCSVVRCVLQLISGLCLHVLQQLIDAKLRELLGERTAADDEKPVKKKKEKPAKVEVVIHSITW